MSITLWGRSNSANVQKARWALEELGLPYEHIQAGGKYGGLDTPEFLALNPNGLVPVLRDTDLVVWDSHAIVRYLAGAYGEGTLWPTDSRNRAVVDQWTDWTATHFQPAWVSVFINVIRTPEHQRDPQKISAALAQTEKLFALLDRRLGEATYLGGEQLTYADIVAGVAMFRWETMPIERQSHGNVRRWHEELRGRPAFRTAVEVDYSDLVAK